MSDLTITIKVGSTSNISKVLEEISHLPQELAGKSPGKESRYNRFWAVFTEALFTHIHKAFLVKAAGGTDELGDKWKPLKRSTIASRPLVPGERKKLGILGLGRGGRGLLTAQENKLWKAIFWKNFTQLIARGMGEGNAKGLAAKMAWGFVKARGAKTKLEVLGGRNVLIHIVSHKLEKSLRAGKANNDQYILPSPDQVFSARGSSVVIGTSVLYSKYLHKTRRLWPKDINKWVKDSADQAAIDLVKQIERTAT